MDAYNFEYSDITGSVLHDILLTSISGPTKKDEETLKKIIAARNKDNSYVMTMQVNGVPMNIKRWVQRFEEHFNDEVARVAKELINEKRYGIDEKLTDLENELTALIQKINPLYKPEKET